jgi:AraC-like DNA-binding protein/ligand-binding sensor domain-containing protein
LEWRAADGLPADRILSLAQDGDGLLWVLTPEHVVSYDGVELRARALPRVSGDAPVGLGLDDTGHVRVVGDRGAWILGPEGMEYLPNPAPPIVDEDLDGELGSNQSALQGEELPPGLTPADVTTYLVDREGGFWIGTRRDGLKYRRPSSVTPIPFGSEEGGSRDMYSVHQDLRGDIWAGSRQGELFKWVNGAFVRITLPTDPFDNEVFIMGDDPSGKLLLGTEHQGLWVLGPEGLAPHEGAGNQREGAVVTLFTDSRSRLWVGRYEESLGFFDGGRFTTVLDQGNYGGKMVFSILEDHRGDLWIGGSSGLVHLPGGETGSGDARRLFSDIHVSSVHEDADRILWITSPRVGLIRLDPQTGESLTFRAQEDLGCAGTYRLVEDDHDTFWVTCHRGVLRIPRDALASFSGRNGELLPAAVFSLSDGLGAVGLEGIKTRDGTILLVTNTGTAAVDPNAVALNKTPPGLVIHSASVAGQAQEMGKGDSPGIELHSGSILSIDVRAVTFRGTESLTYQYRLEGQENEWTLAHTNGALRVDFPDLDPGEYLFEVRAANNHGAWNREGATLAVLVHPTFIQSALFRFLVAASFLLALGGSGYAVRKRQTRLRNRYRKYKVPEKAAERCHRALIQALEVDEIYRDRKLSLKSLAARMGIPPHHVSQVINQRFQKNFFQLVNEYRIREAKRRLRSDVEHAPKIITIAFDVGFNTLNSFNRAFKRQEGMTPTQFRESSRLD